MGSWLGEAMADRRCGQEFGQAIEEALVEILNTLRPLFGPNVVGEGFDLFPEPALHVNDCVAETADVEIPDDLYLISLGLLDIGAPFGPFSELFLNVLLLNLDRDADDDDARQVLVEILTGDGGATFDPERIPGIEGVELVSLTPGAYTLAFDGRATDVLTLQGPGIEAILNDLDMAADLSDGINGLSLIDLASETVATGGQNPIPDLADSEIDAEAELAALLLAAVDPTDARIALLALEPDGFSVQVNNAATGEFDLLVFRGASTEAAIAAASSETVNPFNDVSEIVIADLGGTGPVAPGVTEDELPDVLGMADDRRLVNAVDQGGSVRLEIAGAGDTRDVVAFATTEPVPGGAYDGDLFA